MVTTAVLQERALELGISSLGVCRAEAYVDTEADIIQRRSRGLFADLKFTMARPEVSCHPELAVDGATSVISIALSYWAPDAEHHGDERPRGSIARYTRADAYASLLERMGKLVSMLEADGHRALALVDSNHHVDREAAARSGVGFYGKHTNIITRRHGSWVVLGTIITSVPLEPTEPMRPGCGSCTACIDACPTDAIIEPGVLDVRSCITYWTQSRHQVPDHIRGRSGGMVYGCDICQEACPWNRGTERRLSGSEPVDGTVLIEQWLTATDRDLVDRYQRFFIPQRRARYLRRNALIALGNSGRPEDAALAAPYLFSDDAMLREQAEWSLRAIGGTIAKAALAEAGLPPIDGR